jgi:hypothetical protein
MENPMRRETDKLSSLDIEQMILQEDDQKQRAFLIVLHSINKSLIANTETIREVSEKLETHLEHFETHTKAEEALVNKGRGAWWVAAWVIGVVQVIGLGIWNEARNEIKDIHLALQKEQTMLMQLESRVLFVEKIHGGEKK